jgi:FMN-dependent NADH-azoreductase
MPILLQLDSSADLETSRSRALTAAFADVWRSLSDEHLVVHRDLHRDALPHLSDAALHFPAPLRPAGARPDPEQEALQNALIDELVAADVLLVGVPLYNYSLPSTLKAWVDYIHVPAVTAPFGTTATQPMAGKHAVLVSTRGGTYDAGTATEFDDHAIPALTLILAGALGMSVETVVATRTLSERFGGPDLEVTRQHAEFAAAKDALAQAARRLG